jgi:hypothetical protein
VDRDDLLQHQPVESPFCSSSTLTELGESLYGMECGGALSDMGHSNQPSSSEQCDDLALLVTACQSDNRSETCSATVDVQLMAGVLLQVAHRSFSTHCASLLFYIRPAASRTEHPLDFCWPLPHHSLAPCSAS